MANTEGEITPEPTQPSETAAPPEKIDVALLAAGMPQLSPGLVAFLTEACCVCLDERGHNPGIELKVDGMTDRTYSLHWQRATEAMRASFDDPEYATQYGAYCVASLVLTRLTDYRVVRRSRKSTGFDWWLSRSAGLPFQEAARMEVSGIRNGTSAQITSRLRQKERQTEQSDALAIPAYAVVVEFGRPLSRIAER